VLEIYVDADACPVKSEVCRVAQRYQLNVTFVANSWLRVSNQTGTRLVVVDGDLDAADDWIVAHVGADDIVVTADIPLASRCVKLGARVLDPTGRVFTGANIGPLLATRDFMTGLRAAGVATPGPPPFQKRDRSQFLQSLDQVIQQVTLTAISQKKPGLNPD